MNNTIQNIKRLYGIFNNARVTKKQKISGRDEIIKELKSLGYEANFTTERDKRLKRLLCGHFSGKNENISTKCQKNKYIISAHYDMPSLLSNRCYSYITRKIQVKYSGIIYLLSIIILMYVTYSCVLGLKDGIANFLDLVRKSSFNYFVSGIIAAIFLLSIIRNNILSKYTADDNTSGVVATLTLAKQLKENGIVNVQFIFFDNEEKGLSGSDSYKKDCIDKGTKIINLDSIGRGNQIYVMSDKKHSVFRNELFSLMKNKYNSMKVMGKTISDDNSFTKKGFQALTITRCDVSYIFGKEVPDISWTHTKDDILENINYSHIGEVVQLVIEYIENDTISEENII